MIYTIDDLDDANPSHYEADDLDWRREDDYDTGLTTGLFSVAYVATLVLHEGETGPCDAEGPALVVYRKVGYNGSPTATITQLA